MVSAFNRHLLTGKELPYAQESWGPNPKLAAFWYAELKFFSILCGSFHEEWVYLRGFLRTECSGKMLGLFWAGREQPLAIYVSTQSRSAPPQRFPPSSPTVTLKEIELHCLWLQLKRRAGRQEEMVKQIARLTL